MQDNLITIDIVSDIDCPWCVMGYRNLIQAVDELDLRDKVNIAWHSFELNPDMPDKGEVLKVHFNRKYGVSEKNTNQFIRNITEQGRKIDFEFNFFDDMKIYNTRKAHILLEYIDDLDKQTELQMRLFKAYFTEQKDISQTAVLEQFLAFLGINVEQAIEYMVSEEANFAVRKKQSYWQNIGVASVPTIIFSRHRSLVGAQSVTSYKSVLQQQIFTND